MATQPAPTNNSNRRTSLSLTINPLANMSNNTAKKAEKASINNIEGANNFNMASNEANSVSMSTAELAEELNKALQRIQVISDELKFARKENALLKSQMSKEKITPPPKRKAANNKQNNDTRMSISDGESLVLDEDMAICSNAKNHNNSSSLNTNNTPAFNNNNNRFSILDTATASAASNVNDVNVANNIQVATAQQLNGQKKKVLQASGSSIFEVRRNWLRPI